MSGLWILNFVMAITATIAAGGALTLAVWWSRRPRYYPRHARPVRPRPPAGWLAAPRKLYLLRN